MGFSRKESGMGCHFFSSLFIRMRICGCLSAVSTLLHVPCFRWVLFFCCFSFSVTWELSSVSALVTCLYFKMSKKKTIPAEALCQCVYRMGEGQLVNPWPSVFHDHVGSRISYRDQTTSTPFPPCSLSLRDKPSNMSLGSLNFTLYVFFYKSKM